MTTTILHTFRQSIRAGTGKACIMMRENPLDDFSDEIIAAALTNHATDPQSEGSRGEYIARLIELADLKQKVRIVTAVLDAFESSYQEDWNLSQLFDLAKIFTLQSRPYRERAKKLIYRNYSLYFERGQDWCGENEIL